MPTPNPPPYYVSEEDQAKLEEQRDYLPPMGTFVRLLQTIQRHGPMSVSGIHELWKRDGNPGNFSTLEKTDLWARRKRAVLIVTERGRKLRAKGETFDKELADAQVALAFVKRLTY